MKALLTTALLFAVAGSAVAWDNWNIESRGGNEFEMRPRYDYDYTQRYRGEIESDGYTRMRNPYTGDTLRGYVEDDGYGRLRDSDGNTWKVRPR